MIRKITLALAVLLLVSSAGVVGAQTNETATSTPVNVSDKAPYYEDSSSQVDSDSWLAGNENATLESVLDMATRATNFVVGSGVDAQGGVGSAGVMLTGLIVFGIFAGTMVGTGVGPVGGTVIALVTGLGLMSVGLTPTWMVAIGLMGLGIAFTAMILRGIS